ncbi:pyrophosphate--fructose 6-phosphate 1-phosphotransferase subunit beta-like protein [Tanacetum coccineum]|uniref:Pyrophosphate--fructose 6-phosphate 1-phosphotransferase subunit beta-like protein n=1 Tax=Tanacetum coccineum TaxID=301880 RepID=A0ABQ5GSU9_9ASTR
MVTVAVNQNEPLLSPPSILPESSPTLTSDLIRSLNMRTKDVVKFSLWWSSDDLDTIPFQCLERNSEKRSSVALLLERCASLIESTLSIEPPSLVLSNGGNVTTSRVSLVYSEVQNSRLDHPLALPSFFDKPFKVVDGSVTSAIGNPDEIAKLFPSLFGQHSSVLQLSESNDPASALKIGVVLSGGQAPGGHNVISGMFCKDPNVNGAREVLYMDSRVDQLGS